MCQASLTRQGTVSGKFSLSSRKRIEQKISHWPVYEHTHVDLYDINVYNTHHFEVIVCVYVWHIHQKNAHI